MPRLLAVTPVSHPGGAEVGLLRLLGVLRTRGWEVTTTTPGPGPLRDAAAALGATAELSLGGLARGAGARAVAAWPRARSLARGHDVVYLNGGVAGRLLPALRGARTVLHVHDMVDRVPRMWRSAGVVLADSAAVAARLAPLEAHVVHCPVDLDPPPTEPPWPPDGRPVVGFVGRIEPRKGPLDLARAAPALAEAGARVVLVGDDPFGSDPEYLARVRACAAVEHHGWVENAPGLMRHLDVLVLPSYREPFGTVLAEAMAVGTPVVATEVDGLPEVVEDGITGMLVEPGDPDAIAAAVRRVLAERDAMGRAAAQAAKRFATPAYAERVERLIAP